MAYIRTDHAKLEASAKVIERYSADMKANMKRAQSEIHALGAQWSGSDFSQFKVKWDSLVSADSVYLNMQKALDSYAKYLRYAAAQYKDAQIKAVNRANALPK